MSSHSDEVTSEIDHKIEASSIDSSYWKSKSAGPIINSFFQVLNINRHIPGLKIIITNWSDILAPRPHTKNLEFPIKSVLLFADNLNKIKMIKKMLSPTSKPTIIGGVIKTQRREGDPTIYLTNFRNHRPKATRRITISFAGKEVKSATCYIYTFPNNIGHDGRCSFKERLEQFKQSLDFPIDDGRVVGFLFNMYSHAVDTIFYPISTLFPGVALLRLVMSEIYNLPTRDGPHSVLHLIRY